MSFLTRTLPRSFIAGQQMATQSRGFAVSSARMLKESDHHLPDQAAANERHKNDLLQKQKEGRGHWKPELASNSEEIVCPPNLLPFTIYSLPNIRSHPLALYKLLESGSRCTDSTGNRSRPTEPRKTNL